MKKTKVQRCGSSVIPARMKCVGREGAPAFMLSPENKLEKIWISLTGNLRDDEADAPIKYLMRKLTGRKGA